jgi:rhamnosyltransferase
MTAQITTVSAVIVCFHPDPQALQQLIDKLQPDVQTIWLVNNGPQPLAGPWPAVVKQVQCAGNLGVAGAINLGFDQAFAQGADAVIGFDQDSLPPAGLVEQLRCAWNAMGEKQPQNRLAAIGPAPQDKDTGHMLHTFAPYNWRRRRLTPTIGKSLEVDHLITSGCLISRAAWQDIGPTNEGLFIDWIDVEWCGRARHMGYHLLMDGSVIMPHRIGQKSGGILGRKFHVHSPFRHYFVLRNAMQLFRDPRFPLGWRTHHLLYASRVILANLIWAPERSSRLAHVVRGLRDGWAGRTGPQGQVPD